MFLDMTVRTQPIALRALSGPTRHPPHRNNKKSMKARAAIFPLNPCTSLATMRRGRRLSTNSILSCEVSWPKLPEDDGHAEPSSTRRIRPTISRIFRRARCVDDSVTLRHRSTNGRLRPSARGLRRQIRAAHVALRFLIGIGAKPAKSTDAETSSPPLLARCDEQSCD